MFIHWIGVDLRFFSCLLSRSLGRQILFGLYSLLDQGLCKNIVTFEMVGVSGSDFISALYKFGWWMDV